MTRILKSPKKKEKHYEEEGCEKEAVHPVERVLIIQTAEPVFLLRALKRLENKPQFHNPRYTLFCRNRPDTVKLFREHPMIHQVLIHSEARKSWKHLKNLRREKFGAVVLFMTGDPSYRKAKVFAFLLGVPLRCMLVFNEASDCFFFNWNQWLGLVSRRIREQPNAAVRIKHLHTTYFPISSITKTVLLPFRFFWLLLVWIRLRLSGIKSSRKNHDYSIQLPPFPGT